MGPGLRACEGFPGCVFCGSFRLWREERCHGQPGIGRRIVRRLVSSLLTLTRFALRPSGPACAVVLRGAGSWRVPRFDRCARGCVDQGCDSRDAIVAPARTQAGPLTVYMPTPDEAGENDLSPASRASLRYRRRKEPEAIESRRAGMETRKARDIARRRTCAELIHAHCRNRALERIDVRGRLKAHVIVPVARTGQRHPGNASGPLCKTPETK